MANAAVSSEQSDGIARLRLDQARGARLTMATMQALGAALDAALADDAVRAVVLCAGEQVFCTGLDVAEIETQGTAPALRAGALCAAVERAGKPVVAALDGHATGAGLELALAAHARIARRGVRAGLPEIGRGLLPAAGATQRLPRLLDAASALDVLISGRVAGVESAPLQRLMTRIVEADAEAAAVDVARAMAEAGPPWPRACDIQAGADDPAAYANAIAARRDRLAQIADVPRCLMAARIVECVEAAQLLPFEAGLEFERTAFAEVMETPHSAGLRHAYLAERRAARMPGAAQAGGRGRVGTVAVVGGGPTAAGVALCCLDAGLPVVHFDRDEGALDTARGRILSVYDAAVSADRLSAEARATRMRRWTGTTRLADLGQAQLIVEAVADHLETKQRVFAALDQVAQEGAILASHSLIHPVADLAAQTGRPGDVLGLFFHGSAHHARLAEIIAGPQTDAAAVAALAGVVRGRLGRIAVRAGTGCGPLSEWIIAALRAVAAGFVAQGVAPGRVDGALRRHGMPRGAIEAMDRIGLDVVLARLRVQELHDGFPTRLRPSLERLVAAGRTGARSGAGFYRWEADAPAADPALAQLLEDVEAPRLAVDPVDDDAIWRLSLAAMANAGARLVRTDAAQRPSDIDAVMVNGPGFPRWRGGPMKAADSAGLVQIAKTLHRQAQTAPELFAPDPLFEELIKTGGRFAAMV
ncbi:3-hydroxyacyl-CoA dehydrogenase NAD-binding domain-containing protein [Sediminimonas sp.]|uniref:3-hydroxyacyl-CoA dehydrogenase NAD-binding domain-containing protein n=1 Tax=Sediminimonas sp. TaxID=2823379 RepID=UPI0025DBCA48|nr:3-hydroxyacyl-CoA dehydrogenase NAD-binding domain-containing protein [Sediminimonas sp.]